MINYFDKEDMKNIKKLNAISATKHRCKPHDLNNIDDLTQSLEYAVCAFLDYYHYVAQLDDILGNYDESLEHYDTATWLNFTINSDKADELSSMAYNSLRETLDLFRDLADRAEEHCYNILKIVLAANSEVQKNILGYNYRLNESLVNKIVETIFENIYELEYHYNMQEAFESFKAHINHSIKTVTTSEKNN